MTVLADVFEIIMILCFGISWPFNIAAAYKARTAKGTSIIFTLCIFIGYVAGIASKLVAWAAFGSEYWTFTKILAFVFYAINLTMITIALVIYFRNKKIDKSKTTK